MNAESDVFPPNDFDTVDEALGVDFSIWTTAAGEEIPVADMGERHIRNALAMMRRNGYIGQEDLNYYLYSPGPNGEAAQMAFDAEFAVAMESPANPWIDVLEAELQRRRAA